MPLPPPLKSSAAIRAASTDPMPLVSWKMPEMSLSTPTRTTLSEMSARAGTESATVAAQDKASATDLRKQFMMSSPGYSFLNLPMSGRRDLHRQAFQPAQRVVVATLHRPRDLDRRDLARQRRQHRLALQPRNELPDTHVDAG